MGVMTIGLLTAGLWLLSGQSGAAQQQQQGGMMGMPGMMGGTQGTPEQGGTPTPQPEQPPPQ